MGEKESGRRLEKSVIGALIAFAAVTIVGALVGGAVPIVPALGVSFGVFFTVAFGNLKIAEKRRAKHERAFILAGPAVRRCERS